MKIIITSTLVVLIWAIVLKLILVLATKRYEEIYPLFHEGEKIKLKHKKIVRLGGANNGALEVCVLPAHILVYYNETETHFSFRVFLNAYSDSEILTQDVVLISKVSFENLDFKRIN